VHVQHINNRLIIVNHVNIMEQKQSGPALNDAPVKKKVYQEPKLSLISFASEEGFASSAKVATQLQDITYDATRDAGVWN